MKRNRETREEVTEVGKNYKGSFQEELQGSHKQENKGSNDLTTDKADSGDPEPDGGRFEH